jgi:hypothetical protein
VQIYRARLRSIVVAGLLIVGLLAASTPVAADGHGGPWPLSTRITIKQR